MQLIISKVGQNIFQWVSGNDLFEPVDAGDALNKKGCFFAINQKSIPARWIRDCSTLAKISFAQLVPLLYMPCKGKRGKRVRLHKLTYRGDFVTVI
ncbi:MAG: hypothetical protein V4450_01225 [Bacteroidota bacterium]